MVTSSPAYQYQQGIWGKLKHAGKEAIRRGTPIVKSAIKSGVRYAKKGAKMGGVAAKRGGIAVGHSVASGGRFVGHEVKKNIKEVAKRKIKRTIYWGSGELKEVRADRQRFDRYGNPIRKRYRSRGRRP